MLFGVSLDCPQNKWFGKYWSVQDQEEVARTDPGETQESTEMAKLVMPLHEFSLFIRGGKLGFFQWRGRVKGEGSLLDGISWAIFFRRSQLLDNTDDQICTLCIPAFQSLI